MTLSRRSIITGLISLVAAPAIVRAGSLMPVKAIQPELIRLSDDRLMSDIVGPANVYWATASDFFYLSDTNELRLLHVVDRISFDLAHKLYPAADSL